MEHTEIRIILNYRYVFDHFIIKLPKSSHKFGIAAAESWILLSTRKSPWEQLKENFNQKWRNMIVRVQSEKKKIRACIMPRNMWEFDPPVIARQQKQGDACAWDCDSNQPWAKATAGLSNFSPVQSNFPPHPHASSSSLPLSPDRVWQGVSRRAQVARLL